MKRALIIGATGGIGSALARRLQGDYALTLVGRDTRKLAALRELGRAVPTDIANELEVQALFDDLATLDLLVYAAGDIAPAALESTRQDAYYRVIDANLTGLVFTLKYAAPKLNDGARVLVLGARPELVRYPGFAVYAAAKAAVKALLEVAASEMQGVAFTLVLPKAVKTGLWDKVGSPPGGALEPGEVAAAVAGSLGAEAEAELKVG